MLLLPGRLKTTVKSKPKQDEKGRFLPGNNGGAGRPKGSRNKLGEAFIDNLYQDWQANGAETIARVREERPQDYLKVVASILPKDVNLRRSPYEDMTDAELDAAIIRLGRDLWYLKDDEPGDGSESTEH